MYPPSPTSLIANQRLRWNALGSVVWWALVRSDLWHVLVKMVNSAFGWRSSSWNLLIARAGYLIFTVNIIQAVYTLTSRPSTSRIPVLPSVQTPASTTSSTATSSSRPVESSYPSFPASLSSDSIRERAMRNKARNAVSGAGGMVKSNSTSTMTAQTASAAPNGMGTSATAPSTPLSKLLTPTKLGSPASFRNSDMDTFSLQTPPSWRGVSSLHRSTAGGDLDRSMAVSASSSRAKPSSQSSPDSPTDSSTTSGHGRKTLHADEPYNTGLDPLAVSVYKLRRAAESTSRAASELEVGAF